MNKLVCKIAVSIVVICTLLFTLSISAVAVEMPTIKISSSEASADEVIEVTVSLANNPGIVSMKLQIGYDKSSLTLLEIKDAGNFSVANHNKDENLLVWEGDTLEQNITYNGTIAILRFKVNNGAKGNSTIGLSYNLNDYDIFNHDMKTVEFNVVSGVVSITCPHTNKTSVAAVSATCASTGTKAHEKCSACGKLFLNGKEATEAEISTLIDSTNHTGETRVDGKLDPKCSTKGCTGDTVCTGCETVITKGKDIPPTGEHKEEVRDAKEADCTNEGYTGDTVCTDCKKVISKGKVIPPDNTKHDYQWVVDKKATFEETGLKHEECTRCHDKRSIDTVIPIPICEHSAMQHFANVSATCKKQGTKEHWYCSECNRKYRDEKGMLLVNSEDELIVPVDPENHINTEIRDVKSATCSSEGYTGDKYCTDCNTLIASGSILANNPDGHNFINNKCEYCGKIQVTYYPPTFTYIDDETHLAGGNIRSHVPDSLTMHTDGVYEWNYCLYCQHEYGRVPVAEADINIDDSVDLIVDDPVQSTNDGDDIDVDDNTDDNTDADAAEPEDNNPPTGIAIALLPMALAMAAATIVRKK